MRGAQRRPVRAGGARAAIPEQPRDALQRPLPAPARGGGQASEVGPDRVALRRHGRGPDRCGRRRARHPGGLRLVLGALAWRPRPRPLRMRRLVALAHPLDNQQPRHVARPRTRPARPVPSQPQEPSVLAALSPRRRDDVHAFGVESGRLTRPAQPGPAVFHADDDGVTTPTHRSAGPSCRGGLLRPVGRLHRHGCYRAVTPGTYACNMPVRP